MKFDLEHRLKSPFKWVGGKGRLLSQIVPLLPKEFDRLIEPFCGSASLSLALKPGVPFWINDINEEVIAVWTSIAREWKQLGFKLFSMEQTYNNSSDRKSYYNEMRNLNPDNDKDLTYEQIASRFILLNKAGFNGLYRVNTKGKFNVPWGNKTRVSLVPDNLELLHVYLRKAHISALPAFEVIEDSKRGDFVYVDPPYHETFQGYTEIGFDSGDHCRLAHICNEAILRGVKVAVSNSDTPFVRELYKDWVCHEIARAGTMSSKGDGRQPVKELLFTKGY